MTSLSEDDLIAIAITLDEEEQKTKKRKWVHEAWLKRQTEGEFATLYKELIDDPTKFYEYFRMNENTFNILLQKIENSLKKQDTHWRLSITPRERLAVTLRYLATGDSLKTISFSYRLGHSTVYKIVTETCKIIAEELMAEVMPVPTEEKWKDISKEFLELWNFPNCLASIDGKHVTIQAPPNSGTQYFNYKKTFSVVLLALVDANCNFIAVDVGSYGKNSDGGILAYSNLGKALEHGRLNIPEDAALPGTTIKAPYVIVGDEAFPLKTYLMRPYPGQLLDDDSKRIFNYRLSRARRTVENAFGILSQKFRIYNRRIQAKPENVDNIILTTCVLHNFIRKHESNVHTEATTSANKSGRTELENIPHQGGNSTRYAFHAREVYLKYFNSEIGLVPWQNDKI